MTALRTAAQQALEALSLALSDVDWRADSPTQPVIHKAHAALRTALAQQAEPVQEPAFHGFMSDDGTQVDVCFSPSAPRRDGTYATAYYTAPPQRTAEPVQEPFGYLWPTGRHPEFRFTQQKRDGVDGMPLYTAPPQRTMVPLTEEEILAAVGWERAAMYMKLAPNFPVDEAKKETLTNARAVEKASWEKNHG